MPKRIHKYNKPRDRFDKIRDQVIHHMGMLHEQTRHEISLVAEQAVHNTEQISKLTEQSSRLFELTELMRYELKLKADNLEMMSITRRVTILERKLINKK